MNSTMDYQFPNLTVSSSSLMKYTGPTAYGQDFNKHNDDIRSSSSSSSSSTSTSTIVPTPSTVVIGKGRVPKKASGNRKLRALVQDKIQEYYSSSRSVKSSIVTDVYYTVQEICEKEGNLHHAFVRYELRGCCYVQASESAAREKITATFRDCLHDKYRSSSKNKALRRRQMAEQTKAKASQQKEQEYLKKALEYLETDFMVLPIRRLPEAGCAARQQQQPQTATSSSSLAPTAQPQIPQDQRRRMSETSQQEIEDKKRSIQSLCTKLFGSFPTLTTSTSSSSTRASAALYEHSKPVVSHLNVPFDDLDEIEDIEPLPIPGMDCSSCSSSSSHSDTGGFDEDFLWC